MIAAFNRCDRCPGADDGKRFRADHVARQGFDAMHGGVGLRFRMDVKVGDGEAWLCSFRAFAGCRGISRLPSWRRMRIGSEMEGELGAATGRFMVFP